MTSLSFDGGASEVSVSGRMTEMGDGVELGHLRAMVPRSRLRGSVC